MTANGPLTEDAGEALKLLDAVAALIINPIDPSRLLYPAGTKFVHGERSIRAVMGFLAAARARGQADEPVSAVAHIRHEALEALIARYVASKDNPS